MSFLKVLDTAIIVFLLVAMNPLSPVGISSFHNVYATTRTIYLIGSTSGWNNTIPGPTITVVQNDNINLQLTTVDTSHRFYVDVNNNAQPDCPTPDKCGSSYSSPTTFPFTADFNPGTYTYYCSIHPYMKGTFVVQGFSITANPSSQTLSQAASQLSTITVTSMSGFSGTVTLSPTAPSGITATLSTSSVSVTPTTSGTSNLNITIGSSTAPGPYTVSVTGTSGSLSHTANVAVTVVGPDFMISSDQPSLNIVVGSTGNATITLTSQNGFAGNVNLAATVAPSGPTASFSPTMLSLASGGSAVSKLTVATSSGIYSSVSPGTYTVTVTATGSPSLSHSTTLSITVTSPSSPAASIPAYVLAIAGVAILAVVVIVAYAILRRRPGKPALKAKP